MRYSLFWTLEVPCDQIVTVEPLKERPARERGVLSLALLADRPVRLRFARPLVARGLFGLRREVTGALVGVEEPARFVAALEADR